MAVPSIFSRLGIPLNDLEAYLRGEKHIQDDEKVVSVSFNSTAQKIFIETQKVLTKEQFLKTGIRDYQKNGDQYNNLSVRAYNGLGQAGVEYFQDILKLIPKELQEKSRILGKRTLEEISLFLKENGIEW